MTTPGGISTGVGFRACRLFALDVNGYPKATNTTAYEGVKVTGNKALTVTMPEPRRISFVGDDGVFDLDFLPTQEADYAELRTGKLDWVVDALISGVKNYAVGDFSFFPTGTEKKGFEPQVGLLAYRQAKVEDPDSASKGQRVWQSLFMPKASLISRGQGWSDTPEEHIYSVIPAYVSKHLWGTALGEATEGALQAQMFWGLSWYKPKLVAFVADGVAVDFSFPAAAQAVNTNYSVWDNGTLQAAGITKLTSKVTFAPAPTNGHIIVILYEVA